MERRGQQFAALIALPEEGKSKGGKQLWTCRRREMGQRGNTSLVEGKHMDGVRRPSRVGAGAFINGESRLPVGRCRDEAEAATGLPGERKERPDALASCIPLQPEGCVLFQEGHETVEIMAFPS